MKADVRTDSWVAKKLGLGRNAVHDLRAAHLTEGVDWERHGHAVVYSEAGLEKIAEVVRRQLEDAQADAVMPVEAPVAAEPEWVRPPEAMWRPFTPDPVVLVRVIKQARNPRVLYGQLADDTPVCIQVPVSPLWRPGMQLPCVAVSEGQVEYRGRKPRSWSRWV
jgi:hypothetical protein